MGTYLFVFTNVFPMNLIEVNKSYLTALFKEEVWFCQSA